MKKLIIPIAILLSLIIATTIVVLYGKGYRINTDTTDPRILETGVLVATSEPDGAQVFINGHLTTATNNTINLSPNVYAIKIVKEGYFAWEKRIKIKKGVVSVTGALLFAKAPKLESITEIGVSDPVIDPSKTRLAFNVASQSARQNGIYVFDMSLRPILTLQSSSTQIVDDTFDNFSQAKIIWSPDGREILASISSSENNQLETIYLLKVDSFNQNPQNVTATIEFLKATWEEEIAKKEKAQIEGLNSKTQKLIRENFDVLSWSLDGTKILYIASVSAQLPLVINPPLLGSDSTPQDRSLKENSIYVYDMKEDKNFKIQQPQLHLSWFPDSKHLVYIEDSRIVIIEHDGTNKTTIYAGPFTDNYVFPWPDGSKLVILTNLGNPDITPNLYTVGLK